MILPIAIIVEETVETSLSPSASVPSIESSTLNSTSPLNDHILDGLLSTVFVLRRFDGDLLSDSMSSASEFLSVSSVLAGSEARMIASKEIILNFLERAVPRSYVTFCLISIYDVICILNYRSIPKLYSQLLSLFDVILANIKSRKDRCAFKSVQRKIIFFAALGNTLRDSEYDRLRKTVVNSWVSLCHDHETNKILASKWSAAKNDKTLQIL